MFTFNVVREQHGWAVRMGERMTMPFRSRELAVREATRLANAIRGHGGPAEVLVDADPSEPLRKIEASRSAPASALLSGHWPGPQ